jgi:hypothetical protein
MIVEELETIHQYKKYKVTWYKHRKECRWKIIFSKWWKIHECQWVYDRRVQSHQKRWAL